MSWERRTESIYHCLFSTGLCDDDVCLKTPEGVDWNGTDDISSKGLGKEAGSGWRLGPWKRVNGRSLMVIPQRIPTAPERVLSKACGYGVCCKLQPVVYPWRVQFGSS
ncbi:uncharacterized protein LOC102353633 [Latimeria chalumnae]|uniref:uncharacterized protein LOC102353633 n=1 Tax=Latimeria chalumnae TaxID=7897 RepID=UPI00313CD87F